jgi:hypothetical protein
VVRIKTSGATRRENAESFLSVIARSQRVGAKRRPMTGSATKQSILSLLGEMDCFASLAMTVPFLAV